MLAKSVPASFGLAAASTPQKEQQIPSAHQTGMQGRTAESTANWSNDPPHPPQCFKKGYALLSQISLGMNFQFQGLNKDASTHTQQEILLLCNILGFFLSPSSVYLSFLHILWFHVGVPSGWAVSCHSSTCVWVLSSPLPSSSLPHDSSNNNELSVDSVLSWWKLCSAFFLSHSLFLCTHMRTFFSPLINYWFLLYHRFVGVKGAQSAAL